MLKSTLLTVCLLVTLQADAATAIYKGFQKTDTTKQCIYEWAGKIYTQTVESWQLCPLTIEVRG